jgi:stage II sporulation protein D
MQLQNTFKQVFLPLLSLFVASVFYSCTLFKPLGQHHPTSHGSSSSISTSSVDQWKKTTRVLITRTTTPSQNTILTFNGKATLHGSFGVKRVLGPLHVAIRKGSIYVYDSHKNILARGTKEISVTPLNSKSAIRLGKYSYRGAIHITAREGNILLFVNHLPSEDYLRGVVPAEMPAKEKAVLEALKAQAVAARTYLLGRFGNPQDQDFDIFSSTQDQVYKGTTIETYLGDKAVAETKNTVALYKGKPIQAYYHSTCGGHTANIEEVWGGEKIPYLRSKKDGPSVQRAYCKSSRLFQWEEEWSRTELTEILNQYLRSAKATLNNKPLPQKSSKYFTRLHNIRVIQKTPSGRAKTLQIDTDAGRFHVHGDRVRWALRRNTSGAILWSSHIKVHFGSTIRVSGRGFGHGIGMCQIGAMARARAGHDFKNILRFYYSQVKLVKAKT